MGRLLVGVLSVGAFVGTGIVSGTRARKHAHSLCLKFQATEESRMAALQFKEQGNAMYKEVWL
jgi:hypothetical protein